MRIYSIIAAIVLLMFTIASHAAPGNKQPKTAVSGTLTYGKTTVVFHDAVAYKVIPKGGAKGEVWTVVHLSETPLDRKNVKAEVKKEGRYSSFNNPLELIFDSKDKLCYVYFFVKVGGVSVNTPPIGVTPQVTITNDLAKGRVFMEKAQEGVGSKYQFDVSFSAEIIHF